MKLMLAILYLMVGGTMILVLVALAVVVVGIKHELSSTELSSQTPDALTAWVRRLLGVYVRKPDQSRAFHEGPRRTVDSPHRIRPARQEGMRNEAAESHSSVQAAPSIKQAPVPERLFARARRPRAKRR